MQVSFMFLITLQLFVIQPDSVIEKTYKIFLFADDCSNFFLIQYFF